MMRRRPIARMAVRTAVVSGTAAAVGARAGARHAANSQAPASEAPPTEGRPGPAPDPGSAEGSDRISQLTQLAALRDSGALTEAEFEAEKSKLLG